MKTQATMQADQLGRFACFLDEHPGFSPALKGEDALVCGFHVGECFLTPDEMERLISTPVDMQFATLLRTALPSTSKRRLP